MFGNPSVTSGSLDEMSDADLVRMHADGDTEALGVLCARHRSRLVAAAARIAGQDADDAVQDGCLKAYRGADRFRGDSAVTTWLHRIVVNAAFDLVRRRPRVAEIADEPVTDPRFAQADTRIDVRQQWQRISPDHQAALLLVHMMGYPTAEAAQILGVAEGTVKSRAARARAALAGKLEPESAALPG
jgi:RNA polymerase sigma-70 factor, ECF subfamily